MLALHGVGRQAEALTLFRADPARPVGGARRRSRRGSAPSAPCDPVRHRRADRTRSADPSSSCPATCSRSSAARGRSSAAEPAGPLGRGSPASVRGDPRPAGRRQVGAGRARRARRARPVPRGAAVRRPARRHPERGPPVLARDLQSAAARHRHARRRRAGGRGRGGRPVAEQAPGQAAPRAPRQRGRPGPGQAVRLGAARHGGPGDQPGVSGGRRRLRPAAPGPAVHAEATAKANANQARRRRPRLRRPRPDHPAGAASATVSPWTCACARRRAAGRAAPTGAGARWTARLTDERQRLRELEAGELAVRSSLAASWAPSTAAAARSTATRRGCWACSVCSTCPTSPWRRPRQAVRFAVVRQVERGAGTSV